MELKDKIDYSINLIKRAEKLALQLQPDGLWVGFSGGKDSQVLLELVKLAQVKYKAVYNVTTNDPPDNVYFIRRNYPEVLFSLPNRNFFKIVENRGLPSRLRRFCCAELKENGGAGYVVLTGVRAEESVSRKRYSEVNVYSRRKEHKDRSKQRTIEDIIEHEHKCIKGKDKIMVYPIIKWTAEDILQFHTERQLPKNICYEHSNRVGCMFCPFSTKKEMEYYANRYPKIKERLIKSFDKYLAKKTDKQFETAEEYFDWWLSKLSIKQYKAQKQQLTLTLQS